MDFTGERFIPGCGIDIAFEHYHRYLFAKEFVKGKRVLDLACGEGYGAAMLSQWAQRVIGVDVDIETVKHANLKYAEQNLEFKVADCVDLMGVAEDHSIDVTVFFEAVEHIDNPKQIKTLQEIKRVLKKDGVLIVSTPNKNLLKLAGNPENKYHIHEMTLIEFQDLLEGFFLNVNYFGQRFETGGMIWPAGLKNDDIETSWNLISGDGTSFFQKFPSTDSALFFIAVCSDEGDAVEMGGNILLDEGLNVQVNATAAASTKIFILEDETHVLEGRIQFLEGRINEILDSNSWKITAPLRWLKQIINRADVSNK